VLYGCGQKNRSLQIGQSLVHPEDVEYVAEVLEEVA